MIDNLIAFSIKNKLIIGLFTFALIAWGGYSVTKIPIDAVPDITNNQVQVITQAPALAAQEVEQFITFPIEISLSNLPDVEKIRSISRFGISVITVVFEEDVDIYLARQLISEQLKVAQQDIPEGFGKPEMGPITTGLGEIYQYILHTAPEYDSVYSAMELRSINDWVVKRQLAGTPGIIEVSGWGGFLKQYEVAINPEKLRSLNVTIAEIFESLQNNNENTGGSYIEKEFNSYFIRGDGLMKSISDIENTVVKTVNNSPILIRDVAQVRFGSSARYGAVTYNGEGEVVAGQVLMLKGENSYEVVNAVKNRVEKIKKTLPEGVVLEAFIDRSGMIERAIDTVTTNLIEGGLIVIFILVLLLGNFRGGLIVASVIPLAMLFALCMMNLFGVSANLMSLGAIDFGLIVDGAVIIVESIIHRLYSKYNNKTLSAAEMDEHVHDSSVKIRSSAAFGEIIILIVYLPILALVGVEGKMFGPMAQTVSFAILGALILSLTYVPMMCALFLKKEIVQKTTVADKIINFFQLLYNPVINFALKQRVLMLVSVLILFGMSLITFNRMGGEFIPTLEEGDFALHQILPPGTSLAQGVDVSAKIQNVLLDKFPEIDKIVTKIGTAEIPTDPMPIEVGDIMVQMKPKSEWQYETKDEMFEAMERELKVIAGVGNEFSQPVQMRFNELISGVREDVAIKIYGEDLNVLFQKGKQTQSLIQQIQGAGDIKVEQIVGLPQMLISYNRNKIAQYGLNIKELNTLVRTAFAGEKAGVIFEGEKRFDLVVRLDEAHRQNIDNIKNLYVTLPNGAQLPLSEVAKVEFKEAPMQISRENTKRRITIGVNARNRDVESLVNEINEVLNEKLNLPTGYYIEYGGQFENLVEAKKRLSVAVPIALLLILVLLFFTFGSIKQAFLIFTAIPLSAIGGVYALWLRDMPFSISAGVGFIALFGVAVLNGIVLIGYFNQLKKEGVNDVRERILLGTKVRLRPVIMTASVAALGFLPMALSNSAGGEVQKPLATVVIGGLLTATLLTLVILPILYSFSEKLKINKSVIAPVIIFFGLVGFSNPSFAQGEKLTMEQVVEIALKNHPAMKAADLEIEKQQVLKKTVFDFGKTNVMYSNGQLNSNNIDYQWNVNQKFKFPTSYTAQSAVYNEKVLLMESQKIISQNKLRKEVKSAFAQLSSAIQKLELANEMVKTYQNFALSSQKRFKTGETNIIEYNSASAKAQEVKLLEQQAQADVRIYNSYLQILMGNSESFIIEKIEKLNMEVESASAENNPIISYYKQLLVVNEGELKAHKSAYLPDVSVGYVNQQIEGVSGLQAFQIGVSIPLFFGSNKGKVQASKINNEITQSKIEQSLLELDILLNQKLQELEKGKATLKYYESDGLKIANQLSEAVGIAFKMGEIGYIEYISNVEQANAIKCSYLSSLNQYNQTVIEIDYLMNN